MDTTTISNNNDYDNNDNYELILKEQRDLLVCHKCQQLLLSSLNSRSCPDIRSRRTYTYDTQRNYSFGLHITLLSHVYDNIRVGNGSGSSSNDLRDGCALIYKKLARSHADALVLVILKEILSQLSFSQICVSSLRSPAAILIQTMLMLTAPFIKSLDEIYVNRLMFVHRKENVNRKEVIYSWYF